MTKFINQFPIKSKIVSQFIVLFLSFVFLGHSQNNNTKDAKLFDAYKTYSKLPREVAYGHLNKSTLITGETLGFSVYVFDKYTKKPSDVTTNLYCAIEDESGNTIKNSMILATEGVASGQFQIDSTFASGSYTFKAYTNWMKNFDEQNFYVQQISIINPDDKNAVTPSSDVVRIDAQFLPEGGHLIADAQNIMGVVIKDQKGFGIPYIKGLVYDKEGTELSNFETNAMGIGKFSIIPEPNKVYTVKLNSEEETTITIAPAKAKGINMSLTDLGKRIALVFRTNEKTLSSISNKEFKLSIGNGSQLKVIDVLFNDKTDVTKIINYSDLYPGINIITLFDNKNKPILERLFFKHEGIEQLKSGAVSLVKEGDSLNIAFPIHNINPTALHNFSISVLPEATKSYKHHHNIISYTFLQPYIQGYIENAKYYFTNVDRKKKLELDNLLLTQGWSAYNWNGIFNATPEYSYNFEKGINIKANLNNTKAEQFIIYPMANTETITLEAKNDQKHFEVKGLLPFNDETLNIGAIVKGDRVKKTNLYVQFTPSKIPSFDNKYLSLGYSDGAGFLYNSKEFLLDDSWNDIEELDAVLISAKKDEERIERIKERTSGQVTFLTDIQRDSYTTFGNYISTKGFNVIERGNILEITNTRRTNLSSGGSSPIIYLDKLLLNDFSILTTLDMSIVDYIVVDRAGLGEGVRGAGGVIRIFTNPQLRIKRFNIDKEVGQKIEIPLAFEKSKRFYIPIYSSYRNEFFQNYGVIDWKPMVKVNDKGVLNLKILDTKNDQIKLYIEGYSNDGAYISEEKTITID